MVFTFFLETRALLFYSHVSLRSVPRDKRIQFLLFLTDFFGGQREDPEQWEKTPTGQLSLATTIHQLASEVPDAELRKQLQQTTTKVVTAAAAKVAEAK